MAGEQRARAARRGPPRGREPPGRAGGSNKTNARTCFLQIPLLIEILRPENCYFVFAPSATNRLGPALNCPAGSRPSARTYVVWAGAAQLGEARLTDCPASESDSASHSATAFGWESQPGNPPVPEDTYRLRLTPIDGVEEPGPTRPKVLADPNWAWPPRLHLCRGAVNTPAASGSAAAPFALSVPLRQKVSGHAIRVVSTPSSQGQ